MTLPDSQNIAIQTLKKLISIPSVSRNEKEAADYIQYLLEEHGFSVSRIYNNVWSKLHYSDHLPVVMLNSHIDTVPPVEGWKTDPYEPVVQGKKIFGLGSNDAGASVVSLLALFILLSGEKNLPFNLIYSATAEEEISGRNGVESILEEIGHIDLGIVGEPTGMKMAIAEKGLLVLDCTAYGEPGHAAKGNGNNAIYNALKDIEWIRKYRFGKKSKWTGEVTMQVTLIDGGIKHNVIPGKCHFVVDIRTNDQYSNDEVLDIIKKNLSGSVMERSTRLNASAINPEHPVVKAARKLDVERYGSGTLSDQALMPFPTVKIGPGSPDRSHTANEFIEESEIIHAIESYRKLMKKYAELIDHKGIYENMEQGT